MTGNMFKTIHSGTVLRTRLEITQMPTNRTMDTSSVEYTHNKVYSSEKE